MTTYLELWFSFDIKGHLYIFAICENRFDEDLIDYDMHEL